MKAKSRDILRMVDLKDEHITNFGKGKSLMEKVLDGIYHLIIMDEPREFLEIYCVF